MRGGMVAGCAPADRAEDYVGAGFTGVKGHKPPGFLWPAERWMDEPIWVNKTTQQSRSANSDFLCRRSFEEMPHQKRSPHLMPKETRGAAPCLWEDLRTTSAKIASPALLSPPPQREKQQKRCSHNFMHDRTFCLCKRVAKRAAQGSYNICGLRYVEILGGFCMTGSNSCNRLNLNTNQR